MKVVRKNQKTNKKVKQNFYSHYKKHTNRRNNISKRVPFI